MTKQPKPKYVHAYRDRHGKYRIYFAKAGQPRVALPGPLNSPAFFAAYAKAIAGVELPKVPEPRASRNSMAGLIELYLKAPAYRNLSETSRKTYRRQLDKFRDEHGDKPVDGFGRKHMMHIIGKMADRPEAANTLLKRLKVLMGFAVDIGLITTNPLTGMKTFKSDGDGYHSWTEEEIEAFELRHPIGSKARLAMALMLYTSQRKSDAIRMGWQHVRDGMITVRQQKTGAVLQIPMHPELKAVLDQTPKSNLTFLVTEYGKPFSVNGFGNWMRDRCDEAGLPSCSSHGLRKACARRLKEAGCQDSEIKAITGHATDAEVARYTKGADQTKLAKAAILRLTRANAKSANPSQKVSKSEG